MMVHIPFKQIVTNVHLTRSSLLLPAALVAHRDDVYTFSHIYIDEISQYTKDVQCNASKKSARQVLLLA